MKTSKLPKTDSIQELAKFWDTYDVTDFEDQLEEVAELIFERDSTAELKIHLPLQDAETVRKIAKAKAVDQEDLVREWVLEKLHEEA